MAPRRTRRITGDVASFDAMAAAIRRATKLGLDVGEAVALSFIGHQVEIAKLKRRLTRTLVSMARATVK